VRQSESMGRTVVFDDPASGNVFVIKGSEQA
jgi:hypothetical protein